MLALLDLDYSLNNEAPKEPQQGCENYDVLMRGYEIEKAKWDISNRKCLMIIKSSIIEGIRGAMPDSEVAKDYFSKIEDQFKGSSKVYASTLIKRLVNDKYDGTGSIREHIMKMSNMAAKLKKMEMEISDGFPIHFIMTSLPAEFSPFTINYNAMKVKWSIDELMAMCVQEEERLKASRIDHANQVMQSKKKRYQKFQKQYFKPKSLQFKKKGQSSKEIRQNKGESSSCAEDKANANQDGCHWCGKGGHFKRDCIGYLKWLNKKGTYIVIFVDESLYADYTTNTWWVDSGATIHVANTVQGFATRRTLRSGK